MIVRDKSSWARMVFSIRGSSLAMTWPRILAATAFAAVLTWTPLHERVEHVKLTPTPFTLVGTAMAIFFGFRNNESYDRFWEGRTLWGRMVNVSRSFARQALTLVHCDQALHADDIRAYRKRLVRSTIAYVHAFRHHLRGSDPSEELRQYLNEDDRQRLQGQTNVPVVILQQMGEQIQQAAARGWVHHYHVPVLEQSLTEMTAVQGGCERIRNTPIPFTYNVLIHQIVAIYCVLLPFGLMDTVGTLTPVVVCLISYAFFGLDAIGDEIEQPFQFDDNDLPLHALSRMIEVNLLQLLDTPADQVPELLKPDRHGVLH